MNLIESPALTYAANPQRTPEGARLILLQLLDWTEEARRLCVQLSMDHYPNQQDKLERLEHARMSLEMTRHQAVRAQ